MAYCCNCGSDVMYSGMNAYYCSQECELEATLHTFEGVALEYCLDENNLAHVRTSESNQYVDKIECSLLGVYYPDAIPVTDFL